MTDPKATNPHNNLFVQTLSHPREARSLIEHHFPKDVVNALDLETLTLEGDSFIDPQLRESFCDLLYSVQLQSTTGETQSAYVYLLFEHKSVADRTTAFQLLRYVVRIWEKALRDRVALRPIFPFVVYHGESPWSAPTSIEQLIPAPESFSPYSVHFGFPVLDLSGLSNEALLGNRFVQNLLYVLKYGRRSELGIYLAQILELLRDPQSNLPDTARLETVLIYIMSVNNSLSSEEVTRIAKSVFPLGFEPGSLLDQSFRKGREEGVIVGEIRSLQRILGDQKSSVDELSQKSKDELDSLLQQLQQRFDKR